eukprot:TRINITY_DN2202_c0_g1_i1.p1 TRINITY_DN2202_c0_g1~~TRINITY_DN2202_c0_g1_i1.p1  ORF type:complete len:317 (-),score=75.20 TRINITY_DN2202_c0_g1_i1:144-1001(-)
MEKRKLSKSKHVGFASDSTDSTPLKSANTNSPLKSSSSSSRECSEPDSYVVYSDETVDVAFEDLVLAAIQRNRSRSSANDVVGYICPGGKVIPKPALDDDDDYELWSPIVRELSKSGLSEIVGCVMGGGQERAFNPEKSFKLVFEEDDDVEESENEAFDSRAAVAGDESFVQHDEDDPDWKEVRDMAEQSVLRARRQVERGDDNGERPVRFTDGSLLAAARSYVTGDHVHVKCNGTWYRGVVIDAGLKAVFVEYKRNEDKFRKRLPINSKMLRPANSGGASAHKF